MIITKLEVKMRERERVRARAYAVMNYNPECCAMCSLGSELLLTHIYINSWRLFKALCSSLNRVALTWDVPHIQAIVTGFLWFSSLPPGQWWVNTLDHMHFHPKPFHCIIHRSYYSAHSDSINCKLLYSISQCSVLCEVYSTMKVTCNNTPS